MSDIRPDRSNLPAVPATYTVAYTQQDHEVHDAPIPFHHYFWILNRHKWRIFAFVVASALATFFITARMTPVYEATATLDVDRQLPTSVLGADNSRGGANDADQFLATQIGLIQADSVIRPVARELRLREVDPFFRVDNPQLVKSAGDDEAPIKLSNLHVTRPPNTYLLIISYRSPDPRLAAAVANGVAESYLRHTYNLRFESAEGASKFMTQRLDELKAKMERSSEALAKFEKDLSVINPEQKGNILSARLLQLNTEYTNAQTERVRKEAAYNSMRSGSMEAAIISTQGESLKKLNAQLDDAVSKFTELKLHYAANHPEFKKASAQVAELQRQVRAMQASITEGVGIEYRQALERESMLKTALAQTKAEFDDLNSRSFGYQELKREADADKNLYEELIRKIKEASINASFQNNSVRIADAARPPRKPVFPKKLTNVLIAILASGILGIAAAISSDLLDTTVRDPEQVRRTLRTEVIGALPAMKTWRSRLVGTDSTRGNLVPLRDTGDRQASGYDEAIRTLRNAILLTDFDRRIRSLLITSASPSEGKSTVAAHLASAHAEQRHKTLLIDCDLRRPSVHKFFPSTSVSGLSSVLNASLPWKSAVMPAAGLEDLHIIAAGPPSRRAADLIGKELPRILEEAALDYDLVILDAPPLLGFPEPLQMASYVDGVVVVTLAGQTTRKAVSSVLNTLQRLRANVVGLVLNEVRKNMSDSYYYYGYYGKYYRTEDAPAKSDTAA